MAASPLRLSIFIQHSARCAVYTFHAKVWNLLKFYWLASHGYRLQPWKSPYIQWRFETFLGKEAAGLDAVGLVRLSWKYRKNLKSFADWAATRRSARQPGSVP